MLVAEHQAVVSFLGSRIDTAPLLVAIDGHSAAGKSTLARTIQHQLANVTLIHVDDFYRVMDKRARAALDAEGGYMLYYDWQRLEAQVLQPLSKRQQAMYQQYDWADGSLGKWVVVEPTGVIVVEGVYSTRPELRAYYDVKIFVETSFATRMRRQGQRTDPAEWVERWEAAEVYYTQTYNPRSYADVVVCEQPD